MKKKKTKKIWLRKKDSWKAYQNKKQVIMLKKTD